MAQLPTVKERALDAATAMRQQQPTSREGPLAHRTSPAMPRRQHLTLAVFLAVCLLLSASYVLFASERASYTPAPLAAPRPGHADAAEDFAIDMSDLPSGVLSGDSIAPKLENATLKAELGRATWRFLHTMVARFPEVPTAEERKTLETFMRLFGRLYPCGECARHFRQLLERFPPQTSSRNAAAGWLCFAHNQVNERLGKPAFDCNDIGDFYDCGCGDDKEGKGRKGKEDKDKKDREGEEDRKEEEDKKDKKNHGGTGGTVLNDTRVPAG